MARKDKNVLILNKPYIVKAKTKKVGFFKRKTITLGVDIEIYEFEFEPSVVNTMYKVAEIAATLPTQIYGASDEAAVLRAISKETDKVLKMIALSIHNYHTPVPKELINYLKDNLNTITMLEAFNYTLQALGMENFLQCLILAGGNIKISQPEECKAKTLSDGITKAHQIKANH